MGTGIVHGVPAPSKNVHGDRVITLATAGGLAVIDFFTPCEQATLNNQDADQGSGGITLLPDQAGPVPHLLVQTGKRGKIFFLNRDNLGQYRMGPGCVDEPILETCDGVNQFTPSGTIGGALRTPCLL